MKSKTWLYIIGAGAALAIGYGLYQRSQNTTANGDPASTGSTSGNVALYGGSALGGFALLLLLL